MKVIYKTSFETTQPLAPLEGVHPDGVCFDLEFGFIDKDLVKDVNLVFDLTTGMANTQDFIHFQIMQLLTHVYDLEDSDMRIYIRINWLSSSRGLQDLELLTQRFSDKDFTLIIPALHQSSELNWLIGYLEARGCSNWRLIPTIETASALDTIEDFLLPQVEALVFDKRFIHRPRNADESANYRKDNHALKLEKQAVVAAAEKAGIEAFDMSALPIGDPAAYRELVNEHKALGFVGFFALHPSQIKSLQAIEE